MIGILVIMILVLSINPSEEFMMCVGGFTLIVFLLAMIELSRMNSSNSQKKEGNNQ